MENAHYRKQAKGSKMKARPDEEFAEMLSNGEGKSADGILERPIDTVDSNTAAELAIRKDLSHSTETLFRQKRQQQKLSVAAIAALTKPSATNSTRAPLDAASSSALLLQQRLHPLPQRERPPKQASIDSVALTISCSEDNAASNSPVLGKRQQLWLDMLSKRPRIEGGPEMNEWLLQVLAVSEAIQRYELREKQQMGRAEAIDDVECKETVTCDNDAASSAGEYDTSASLSSEESRSHSGRNYKPTDAIKVQESNVSSYSSSNGGGHTSSSSMTSSHHHHQQDSFNSSGDSCSNKEKQENNGSSRILRDHHRPIVLHSILRPKSNIPTSVVVINRPRLECIHSTVLPLTALLLDNQLLTAQELKHSFSATITLENSNVYDYCIDDGTAWEHERRQKFKPEARNVESAAECCLGEEDENVCILCKSFANHIRWANSCFGSCCEDVMLLLEV